MQTETVQRWLQQGKDIGANLDQNPNVMALFGPVLPVVLASISNMWSVVRGRPFTEKDSILCHSCRKAARPRLILIGSALRALWFSARYVCGIQGVGVGVAIHNTHTWNTTSSQRFGFRGVG